MMAKAWIPITAATIGAIAVIMAAFIQSYRSNEKTPFGDITAPISDQRVGVTFSVQGTLRGIPKDRHVWIAVQVGNLIWPKAEIINRHRSWLKELSHAGRSGDKFAVVLLLVGKEGENQILNWYRLGEKTGNFPGIKEIAESTVLDIVQLRVEIDSNG